MDQLLVTRLLVKVRKGDFRLYLIRGCGTEEQVSYWYRVNVVPSHTSLKGWFSRGNIRSVYVKQVYMGSVPV